MAPALLATLAESRPAPRWQARLRLHYRREGARTVAHDLHDGPLRVLKALHPEGDAVCHHEMWQREPQPPRVWRT